MSALAVLRKHLKIAGLLVFGLTMQLAVAGKTIYVDDDGTGANDGSTWADAYNCLQDALADANSAEKPVEIRVAQGIYRPDRSAAEPSGTGDRGATFRLINGVAIRGGYAGFREPRPNARNIKLYKAILSGDLNSDDGHNFWNNEENSYHVLCGRRPPVGPTAVLDGFTISGGNADGGYPEDRGGGMYLGGPTILNCSIVRNRASQCGGAVYVAGCRPGQFVRCTIKNNVADLKGGGIFLDCSSADFVNCAIVKNTAAKDGGAIYSRCSFPEIRNCTLSGNNAETGKGGGICCAGEIAELEDSIVWDNAAAAVGPEIALVDPEGCIANRLNVDHSCIGGGQDAICDPCDRVGWGAGNISIDPLFADTDKGGYHLKSEAGRWDPNSQTWVQDNITSPCIDAGDPTTPIGHELFPNGGVINMGAYGGAVEASKSYFGEPVCETIVAGDINGDCKVNFADFAIMATHWLEDNTPSGAVTTTYVFQPDPNALTTSGGFAGQGQGSSSIEGRFELTTDLDVGMAWFNNVDATLSKKIYLCDHDRGDYFTDSLDAFFHMSELVSTDVSDRALDFVLERNIPSFPRADIHLTVIFLDDSVRLVGDFCEPVYDGFCYHLDAVAIAEAMRGTKEK